MKDQIKIGAVAYDAKVVPIWEGIRDYFVESGVPFDYILFSNYEAQVEALFDGVIDIAWNTNLAFVKVEKRLKEQSLLLAMRDTDLEFTSKIIVPAKSQIQELSDLRGKRVAFGSRDSAQAAVMPEYYLRLAKLIPDSDYTAVRFNTDVGKHGDTGRSESDVLAALRAGQADAGAIGESTWLRLASEGGAADFRSIWTSAPYSHCNFTALPGLPEGKAEAFVSTLLKMDYNNPAHRPILEMEGLKQWVKGERKGYDSVFAAVEATGYEKSGEKLSVGRSAR